MVSNKRAEVCAKTLAQFCKEQDGCQNCIFRAFGADRWKCHVGEPEWWYLEEVAGNMEAKKRNHGYL